MQKQSFEPIIPNVPQILILGSLPGDLSIAEHQYYAHPQNRFWKILFHLFEKDFQKDYKQRLAFLEQHHIALWDVCATAVRPGSMDSDISEVMPNDIPTLLAKYPSISHIYFNGQKAQKLHDQYLEKDPSRHYYTLPSSSPANARFSFDKLLLSWQIIKQ